MSIWFSDNKVKPFNAGGLSWVDFRDLPTTKKQEFFSVVQDNLSVLPLSLYCGLEENESAAVDRALLEQEKTQNEAEEVRLQFRSTFGNRTSNQQYFGDGVVFIAGANQNNTIKVAAQLISTETLQIVNQTAYIRCTLLIFIDNIQRLLDSDNFSRQDYINIAVTIGRYLLLNPIEAQGTTAKLQVYELDEHMKGNTATEASAFTIALDNALDAAFSAYPDIQLVPTLDGARVYNRYRAA